MKFNTRAFICATAVFMAVAPFSCSAAGAAVSAEIPAGYRLLYEQNFEQAGPAKDFVFTDPSAWKVTGTGKDRALELLKQSKYEPSVRSPFNIALIADRRFGDFILEADLIQTGKEYGHRDMCLFFGVQDPSHFYYAHMATKTDEHAHNIFIVNDEPRTKISDKTTDGVNWGGLETWHHVRLERKASDGTIELFFDDMHTPIMTATDKTLGAGYVGIGSFDDTGKVKNIKIWSPEVEKKKTEFYQRP